MSYVLTIGFLHDSLRPEIIAGPEIPYEEQRLRFKTEFAPVRNHERFARVDFLDSRRGIRKHKNFITPAEKTRRDEALKLQEEAFAGSGSAEAVPPTPPWKKSGKKAAAAEAAEAGAETETETETDCSPALE